MKDDWNGKKNLAKACIVGGQPETLVLLKEAGIEIVLSREDTKSLVSYCLAKGLCDKAELALKNFPHFPESAEQVILRLLALGRDKDEDTRKMYWERAYNVGRAQEPMIFLDKLLDIALAEGYYDKISSLCQDIGRELFPFEVSALFASLLERKKTPEAFEMKNVLSVKDKRKLVDYCAENGLVERWLEARKIAGCGSEPTESECAAMALGIEAKAKRQKDVVMRNAD